ncbi:MAG: rod shape-determining protein MreC [Wenzhouxiangellaceae bacterium]|nr:rod shape-determining protein MreC [Wenzhouxiangellaceae bacterium]
MNGPARSDRTRVPGTGHGAARGTARLMFYSLLAITLMALDYRGQYVERVRSTAAQLAEPLFWVVDLPFTGAGRLVETFRERGESRRRIRELETEMTRLRARLGLVADLEAENLRLRSLLDAALRSKQEFVAAELAAVDLDPFAHRIIVKRGRTDGVAAGMPVIDSRGVIGQVDEVYSHMARVVLITDPDHALPVQVLPNGERTIAYGSGSLDLLRLSDLPMNSPVQPGDLVVTSGIGGRFPAGLPVGQVESVQRPPGEPFASARVVPLAAMDRNRIVLLLEPARPEPVPGTGSETDAPPQAAEKDR